RRRRRQASIAASMGDLPSSCFTFANSTIRMAFLQARPISTMKPIWVKMLLSPWLSQTPVMAKSRHIGTMRMIASGKRKLSHRAVRTVGFLHLHQSAERHALALRVTGLEPGDVFGPRAEGSIGLRDHLESAAKPVEVVHIKRA